MKTNVKQRDITDCGAACLASVAAHYNLKWPVAKIRQCASTDKKGTNILGLTEAAKKMGFQAKGVYANFDDLPTVPMPAIAHLIVKEVLHHYVVIYQVYGAYVELMDPAEGKMIKKDHQEFKKEWDGVLVILSPDDTFKPEDTTTSTVKRFVKLIHPHKSVMLQVLLGAILYTVLGLSTAIYVQKIVDQVLKDHNPQLLNVLSLGMFALLGLQVLIGSLRTVFTLRTGQKIDKNLILGYYKHLMKLPQQFFDTMRIGEIISRINDAVKIRTFINDISTGVAVNILVVLFSFGLMFSYYWKLAVMLMVTIPLYVLIYYVVNLMNKRVQRKLMEDSAELESQLVESITSAATIKKFGLEDFANAKTEKRFMELMASVYQSGMNSVFSAVSTETIAKIFTIIVLWVGAGYVLKGQITAGELLSFYTLVGYFTAPAASLVGVNKAVQDAVIAADRLFEIMDLEVESENQRLSMCPDEVGDISFEGVSFRYGTRVSVFNDLNLRIAKGQTTAIVGDSGSGKSTLMALLQNIYPIQQGHIFIGKYPVKDIQNVALRKLVGVVPQHIDLFSGNVTDNIALGDPFPNEKEIMEICEGLGILKFIHELPDGFNTQLGEHGVSLSGGQKQRLAIARALYRKPEILLLDEATSSLDSSAEEYVQKMINYLSERGKTIIMIAHRLSTIQKADKIIVLKQGRVSEQGTHLELMEMHLDYYGFWKKQCQMPAGLEPVTG
eukprot:gene17860-21294_t